MIRRRLLGDGSVVAVRDGKSPRKAPRFWYKNAEQNMPVEVRMALARFRQLPEKIRAQLPAWGWLLGGGTPKLKMEQADVQYGSPPSNPLTQHHRCQNCNRFYQHVPTGTGVCDWVRGVIAPNAWCNRWAPAITREAYVRYQDGGK